MNQQQPHDTDDAAADVDVDNNAADVNAENNATDVNADDNADNDADNDADGKADNNAATKTMRHLARTCLQGITLFSTAAWQLGWETHSEFCGIPQLFQFWTFQTPEFLSEFYLSDRKICSRQF